MGVKIHSTYIIKDTKLEEMYNLGEYAPISIEYYVENVCKIISHLKPNIIICRITGDAPKNILVAPEWNSHKKIVVNSINRTLENQNIYQGMLYNKKQDLN